MKDGGKIRVGDEEEIKALTGRVLGRPSAWISRSPRKVREGGAKRKAVSQLLDSPKMKGRNQEVVIGDSTGRTTVVNQCMSLSLHT